MLNTPVLDDFGEIPNLPVANEKAKKICTRIEWTLWALFGVFIALKYAAINMMTNELLIIFGSLLALLYLLFPIWLFGSLGWRRHIGSHLVGFVLMYSVVVMLHILNHWTGAAMQVENQHKLMVMASGLTLLFYFLRRGTPRGNQFFLGILARVIPIWLTMGLLASLDWPMFSAKSGIN
jgi:phosphatidylserine synthase